MTAEVLRELQAQLRKAERERDRMIALAYEAVDTAMYSVEAAAKPMPENLLQWLVRVIGGQPRPTAMNPFQLAHVRHLRHQLPPRN